MIGDESLEEFVVVDEDNEKSEDEYENEDEEKSYEEPNDVVVSNKEKKRMSEDEIENDDEIGESNDVVVNRKENEMSEEEETINENVDSIIGKQGEELTIIPPCQDNGLGLLLSVHCFFPTINETSYIHLNNLNKIATDAALGNGKLGVRLVPNASEHDVCDDGYDFKYDNICIQLKQDVTKKYIQRHENEIFLEVNNYLENIDDIIGENSE